MAVSEIQGRRQKLIKVLQGKIMNADYEYEKEKERTDTVRSPQAQAQLKGTQPVSDVKAEKNGKLKTQQLDLANNELDIKKKMRRMTWLSSKTWICVLIETLKKLKASSKKLRRITPKNYPRSRKQTPTLKASI